MRDLSRLFRYLLLVGLGFLIFGHFARAQFEDGGLVGTIHDASGATVAHAIISVTNVNTGITAKTSTNDQGAYEFPALRVGVYTVTAEAEGFSVAIAKNITISVGNRQHIDLTLQVGGAQTSVQVSDVALQLETESSQRSQNVTQYQTEALPLVTRNYADLLGLITGSHQAFAGATTTSVSSLVRQGAYNVNGQRSMFNNFLLDGLDNNAYGESNQGFDNQIIAPAPDSIAQFSVVTNNESAEYGRSSGATINVASASGTNNYHATVYEFLRNTDLNAIGFFTPPGGVKPTFNRNQFGMNFGGPILKNKLFFFLDYEGFRQTLKPLNFLSLPNGGQRAGVLPIDIQDPLHPGTYYKAGTPLLNQPGISPLSTKILGYLNQLAPSNGSLCPGNPTSITNDCSTLAPFTDNADKGDLRLDWQQNQNNSYFLRISDRKETGINFPTLALPLDGGTNGRTQILDQQIALGWTRSISTNKLLEARLGLSRTKAGKFSLSIGDNSFNIPGLPTDPTVAGGLSSTVFSGGFSALGRQSTNPQWQNPALIDPKVNFSWVKGKHTLKFGYEYEHVWMAVQDANPLYGGFAYQGGFSACPSANGQPVSPNCTSINKTADTYWADFLFGATSGYSIATYFVAHLEQDSHYAYAQDDWKLTPKLTLNLGLRWEYGSPYYELHNHLSNFDPTTQTMIQAKSGGMYDRSLVHPDLADFGPRLGFAYAVDSKTSLRGGYGISYAHYTRAGSGDILAINAPQALFAAVQQSPTSTTNVLPYRTVDQGFPQGLTSTFNTLAQQTDNITYINPNRRDTYVQNYFFSVQRQIAKNTLVDIAYVGNRGLRLEGLLNANQKNPANGFARPLPAWGDITEARNAFSSHYDALQARYEQRFVGGLTLLDSFTWSHSMDNASASLEGNTPSPQNGLNINADYSQSDYNQPLINSISLVYELPIGHGRRFLSNSNGFLNQVIGGWQISAINQAQAGTPFNLTYTPTSNNQVSPLISATYRGANEYRPNRVAGQPLINKNWKNKLANGSIQYINYAALVTPFQQTSTGALQSPFGNLSRNPGRTPAYNSTDIAMNKRFNTPLESLKIEFRGEMYNAFNRTNFYLPSSGLSGTQYLNQTAFQSAANATNGLTSGGTITSTYEPRIVQFGLKIIY
jgi:Carboxypeptidase regulatory-like domain